MLLPGHAFETSEVGVEAPEVVFEAADVAFEAVEVAFEAAEVAFEDAEVAFEAAEVVFEALDVVCEAAEVVFEASDVVCEALCIGALGEGPGGLGGRSRKFKGVRESGDIGGPSGPGLWRLPLLFHNRTVVKQETRTTTKKRSR